MRTNTHGRAVGKTLLPFLFLLSNACVNFTPIKPHCVTGEVCKVGLDGVDNTDEGDGEGVMGPSGDSGPTGPTGPATYSSITASPTVVPQGYGAAPRNLPVVITVLGTNLSQVSGVALSDGTVGVIDATERSETSMTARFLVPHGASTGAKSLTISATTNTTIASLFIVTNIKVVPAAAATPGNDNATGSTAAPFATLNRALEVAGTDDTILLAPRAIADHTVGVGMAAAGACSDTCTNGCAHNVPTGVTLRGDGGVARIAGLFAGAGTTMGLVSQGNATYESLEVVGFGTGILACGTLSLQNVTASSHLQKGVVLAGDGIVTLDHVVALDNQSHGILALKTAGSVFGEDITAGTSSSGHGIVLDGPFNVAFSRVQTEANALTGFSANITQLGMTGFASSTNDIGLAILGSTQAQVDLNDAAAPFPFLRGEVRFNRVVGVDLRDSAVLTLLGEPTQQTQITGNRLTVASDIAAIRLTQSSALTAANLVIDNCTGPAIRLAQMEPAAARHATLNLSNSVINGNNASPYGIVHFSSEPITLTNVTFQDHTTSAIYGAGFGALTVGAMALSGCQIACPTAPNASYGIDVQTNAPAGVTPVSITGTAINDCTLGAINFASGAHLVARNSSFNYRVGGVTALTGGMAYLLARDDGATVDLGAGVIDGNNTFLCADGFILHDYRSALAMTPHTLADVKFTSNNPSLLGSCVSTPCDSDDLAAFLPACFEANIQPAVLYDNPPGTGQCAARGVLHR